jgi:hypothetical protein
MHPPVKPINIKIMSNDKHNNLQPDGPMIKQAVVVKIGVALYPIQKSENDQSQQITLNYGIEDHVVKESFSEDLLTFGIRIHLLQYHHQNCGCDYDN